MKARIKEEPNNKKRYVYVNIDKQDFDFTKIKIVFDDELGWVMKLGVFGVDILTSIELREIARKLDEYNKDITNTKRWKQQTNSKNL